ncbi:sugar phosphate isomerase/epimerase family protein [Paenibacillus periandrae]|uniref:sugar phosphate isomerase/epimerase family protein n=1 Tax=Paenibacillus periandrae TaxID=1761741 RepID=UPI001F09EF1F|nr:sugar phosphate isomerase/epimerase family protein [Paenibacillus periandrae]
MSVGILAHNVGAQPFAQLAAKVASYRFDYVQLALSKAITDVDCSLGKLSPGLANAIGEAFDKQGVGIPVLGCYMDLIELDDTKWRHNVDRFKEHLRYARQFGASIVATETGVPVIQEHDRNWRRLRSAVEEMAEEAEKFGIMIGLEVASRHIVGTARDLAQLIDEVPSSNIGVVMDPCNLMTQDNYEGQHEIMQEAFRLLGHRVVSAHSKDIKLDADGKLQTVSSGQGILNYPMFIELLNQHKPLSYITLENAQEPYTSDARDFVLKQRG